MRGRPHRKKWAPPRKSDSDGSHDLTSADLQERRDQDMKKRRNHAARFKALVELEALKGERTVSELAVEYVVQARHEKRGSRASGHRTATDAQTPRPGHMNRYSQAPRDRRATASRSVAVCAISRLRSSANPPASRRRGQSCLDVPEPGRNQERGVSEVRKLCLDAGQALVKYICT